MSWTIAKGMLIRDAIQAGVGLGLVVLLAAVCVVVAVLEQRRARRSAKKGTP